MVSSCSDWAAVCSEVRRDLRQVSVLGVDCEWVNRGKTQSPVSLLQLATISGLCVLVRLCHLRTIPTSLKEILSNPDIYKVGVGITEDRAKLLCDYSVDMVSCVDLRHLVVRYWSHQGKLGLEALARLVLGVSLDKDWRIRASDWEAESLSNRQVDYAANDALVAVNIAWVVVISHLQNSVANRIRSLLWSAETLSQELVKILQQFADLKFSTSSSRQSSRTTKEKSPMTPKVFANSIRKSPLYHNCQLEAPDGQLLCTSDEKKALWYVSKGLGYKVREDPLTVRLNFEPSGRPEGTAGEYYLSVKPNICVVCGRDQSFLRKSVVPHEYRKYFPAVMKDHQSHDVVLLCPSCHHQSNLQDSHLRRRLGEECGASLGGETELKVRTNHDQRRLRSAGRALQGNRGTKPGKGIPETRLEELLAVIREHYDTDTVDEDMIDRAANCSVTEENESYVPHSRAVVQYFLERGGLLELEVRWRQHFLDTMSPQHLPPLWSVNHQADRLHTKAQDNRIDMEQYRLATQGVSQPIDLEAYRTVRRVQLGVNPELDPEVNPEVNTEVNTEVKE